MDLEHFVKTGMLNRLKKERKFFEDNSPEREVYCITESKGHGNYEFLYVTRKAERKIEPITPHLKDNYLGTLDDLSDIILKRMKTDLKCRTPLY